jgi:hypothetical protein
MSFSPRAAYLMKCACVRAHVRVWAGGLAGSYKRASCGGHLQFGTSTVDSEKPGQSVNRGCLRLTSTAYSWSAGDSLRPDFRHFVARLPQLTRITEACARSPGQSQSQNTQHPIDLGKFFLQATHESSRVRLRGGRQPRNLCVHKARQHKLTVCPTYAVKK